MKRKLNRIVQSNIYRCMIIMLGVHQKESDVRTTFIISMDPLARQFNKVDNIF